MQQKIIHICSMKTEEQVTLRPIVGKGKNKKVKTVEKQVVDVETGELLDVTTEHHFVSEVKSDKFYMTFIENLAPFYGLKNAKDKDLIVALCEHAEFNTGIVRLTPKERQIICEKISINPRNISRHLKRLEEANLIHQDMGNITLNSAVFFKGTIKQRTEILRSEGILFQVRFVEAV